MTWLKRTIFVISIPAAFYCNYYPAACALGFGLLAYTIACSSLFRVIAPRHAARFWRDAFAVLSPVSAYDAYVEIYRSGLRAVHICGGLLIGLVSFGIDKVFPGSWLLILVVCISCAGYFSILKTEGLVKVRFGLLGLLINGVAITYSLMAFDRISALDAVAYSAVGLACAATFYLLHLFVRFIRTSPLQLE